MENTKIKSLITQMTLEEKASLLSGFDFWTTKEIKRLNIPAIPMADGPHGLRKQKKNELGINKSYPSTCFPTAALLACSWDEELAYKQGEAIGKEARVLGLGCVLGPGTNIKRSPLCGRNFEYFSEDPLLSGRMAAGVINGLQSQEISACLKHFAVNNQEDYRFWVDVKIDERALREIYLASFEYALMFSKPKAIMCSYNKINGIYASENRRLLTEILRDEWGFDGIVMSDWGAVNNRPQGVWAGLDLEMPGSYGINDNEIVKSANNQKTHFPATDPAFSGKLTEAEIDICVERMLKFILDLEHTIKPITGDITEHHSTARDIAAECMVLLENSGILPLKQGSNIAVMGDIAKKPVYQGGGSSRVVPIKTDIPFDEIAKFANAEYITELEQAKGKDSVILFLGMPDNFDTEGSDRRGMELPAEQYDLVEKVKAVNENVILVICVGAPVIMPNAPNILMAYLGGEAMGGAVADILFGVKNPCGKLAETFPKRIEDTPAYLNFPGDRATVNYGEGIYVGYRWYNARKIRPQYSFGEGLSYTKFKYSEWEITGGGGRVTVSNVGEYDGKEIVQLYIDGELRGFKKVLIKKGESVTLDVAITPKAGRTAKSEPRKITMCSEVRELFTHPNGLSLIKEIAEHFDIVITEETLATTDCSHFIGNILRNMVTMFNMPLSLDELQEKIDRVNTIDKQA
ncbi:MAG: glycoside hydrolase family 3 C-terminal domain-containing protein [Oscillospiraceae bacterium]|nr:glycoside hydrolase family 3 C-terminal domain-containing protein [Oscillospiraceae bacterium]